MTLGIRLASAWRAWCSWPAGPSQCECGGAASGDEPVASLWPHNTAKDQQTTQDNERHPRRPDGMFPGRKQA